MATSSKSRDARKTEFLAQFDALEKQAKRKMNDLNIIKEQAWADIKEGVERSWNELKLAARKIRGRWKNKDFNPTINK